MRNRYGRGRFDEGDEETVQNREENSEQGESEIAGSSSLWCPTHRNLTLGLILTNFGCAFEAMAVATSLPLVVRDLGGLRLYGWVFSAFMLANLVGITVAGSETDRRGPVRPFACGVALFMVGLLIAGGAPVMLALVFGRIVQGFGAGIISAVSYAVIGRLYSPQQKPKMLAAMSSAWIVPGLVGPAIAGYMAEHLGWRYVFLGLAPFTPLAAGLALPALRRVPAAFADALPDLPRLWNALRLAVGLGMILAGLSQKYALLVPLLLLPGLALAYAPLSRLLPAGTLRARPGIPSAIVVMSLLNLVYFGVEAFLPLSLTMLRGQRATFAGLVLTSACLTWTLGSYTQARLVAHTSRRRLVLSGLLILLLGISGVASVLLPFLPIWIVPLGWGLAGFGMGIASSTSTLVVLEMAPKGEEGTLSASMQLGDVLGVAVGTGIGGFLVGLTALRPGIVLVDSLMFILTCLALIPASRLPRHAKPETHASSQ